jgi:hypothetical protein
MAVQDVEEAAARLQVWAFPLVFAQRVRLNFTQPADPSAVRPPTSAGAPTNRLGHQRQLSTPDLRVGVAPNVDTLYSVAWVDLDAGPQVLTLPDMGERYYSVQVALSDTSSPWALGRRTHGGGLPPVTVTRGPLGLQESADAVHLGTPHRHLMLCVRTLVEPDDPRDLGRVTALQDAMRLEPAEGARRRASSDVVGRDIALASVDRAAEIGDASAFARAVAAVIEDSAPESVPEQVHADLATCGLDGGRAAPADAARIAAGLAAGLARIEAHVRVMGEVVDGWALNRLGPDFGDDLLLRAAVALSQIFINPVAEAIYPVCEVDETGWPLDAATNDYELVLDAGNLPPVDSFWSLTMYHAAGLLVANEAGRYAIGDRTPGLVRGPDGSVAVHVSRTRPASAHVNWLPAPDGPFRLMLRLYGPRDLSWRPPPVRRLDADR